MFVAQDAGHSDKVTYMALNVYYNLIATCSLDKTIRIFDCSDSNSFTHLETLSDGHDAEICQVAWSHPFAGNFLASCGMDHRVVIWRPEDDNQTLDLLSVCASEAHGLPKSIQNATPSGWKIDLLCDKFEASVNSIDFAPYQAGTRLIAVGAERKIVILTLTSEKLWIPSEIIDNESVSLGMFSVNWAPASSSLVRIHDETSGQPSIQMISRFAVGGFDGVLQVWQQSTNNNDYDEKWNLQFKSEPLPDWIRVLKWCPLLIDENDVSKSQLAVGLHDGRVFLWEYSDDSCAWTAKILIRGERYVSSISWSMCGSMLSVSFADIRTVVLQRNIDETWTKLCTRVER